MQPRRLPVLNPYLHPSPTPEHYARVGDWDRCIELAKPYEPARRDLLFSPRNPNERARAHSTRLAPFPGNGIVPNADQAPSRCGS